MKKMRYKQLMKIQKWWPPLHQRNWNLIHRQVLLPVVLPARQDLPPPGNAVIISSVVTGKQLHARTFVCLIHLVAKQNDLFVFFIIKNIVSLQLYLFFAGFRLFFCWTYQPYSTVRPLTRKTPNLLAIRIYVLIFIGNGRERVVRKF